MHLILELNKRQHVLIAGDTLELAVFLSVKMEDEAAFERNYQQLQMYTSDTRCLLTLSYVTTGNMQLCGASLVLAKMTS